MVAMGIGRTIGSAAGTGLAISTAAAGLLPIASQSGLFATALMTAFPTSVLAGNIAGALAGAGMWLSQTLPFLGSIGTPIITALAATGPILGAALAIGAIVMLPTLFKAVGGVVDNAIDTAKAKAAHMNQRLQTQSQPIVQQGKSQEMELQHTMRQPNGAMQHHSRGNHTPDTPQNFEGPSHPGYNKPDGHWENAHHEQQRDPQRRPAHSPSVPSM